MNNLQAIRDNSVYQQVLKDSFGGVMYNVANYGKYDSDEVLGLVSKLSAQEKSAMDGIMKGALNFLQGN